MNERRTLRFSTIDDALADVDRLVALEREGKLKQLGNWTLGQACGHIAGWADYAYEGYPFKVSFLLKVIGGMIKRRFLEKPMNPGGKVPGIAGGTLATEALSTSEGVARLKKAFSRLKASPPVKRHPVFGNMTHEQWIKLNLRHAELHLSFFVSS